MEELDCIDGDCYDVCNNPDCERCNLVNEPIILKD
jgi:hypothetical protein